MPVYKKYFTHDLGNDPKAYRPFVKTDSKYFSIYDQERQITHTHTHIMVIMYATVQSD